MLIPGKGLLLSEQKQRIVGWEGGAEGSEGRERGKRREGKLQSGYKINLIKVLKRGKKVEHFHIKMREILQLFEEELIVTDGDISPILILIH